MTNQMMGKLITHPGSRALKKVRGGGPVCGNVSTCWMGPGGLVKGFQAASPLVTGKS